MEYGWDGVESADVDLCVCEGWTCMWSADALPVNGWVG